MKLSLPDLPFEMNALEPHISARTLEFHYGKHHQAYVNKANPLIEEGPFAEMSLEQIIKNTAGKPEHAALFNNCAQVWNHSFFWNSMKADGGGIPNGAIAEKMDQDLGGYDNFVSEFKKAAATQFGSGWAWLVVAENTLKIVKTANADTPLAHNQKALLTIDVWEHAYYLDFQNRRPDYIDAYISHLINWDFVNQRLNG